MLQKAWRTLLVLALAFPATALAEEAWPPKQITIVMPHDVGSSHNAQMRALGEVWEQKLGTKFVYENREGASGRVGYDVFLRRAKDGATLLSSNLAANAIMYAQQKPNWTFLEEIYPFGTFGVDPGAIFVRKDSPYKTINDVVEAAKKRELSLGLAFWHSTDNLQIHQVMDQTGAKFKIIPHSNSSEIVTQVIGGHLDVGYNKVGTVRRGGDDIRILAITMGTNPIGEATNNAPTVDAALGTTTLPSASYRSIMAHKEWADKNPQHVEKLTSTLNESLKDPKVVEAMKRTGVQPELLINMGNQEQVDEVLERYWDAYRKYGSIYNQ